MLHRIFDIVDFFDEFGGEYDGGAIGDEYIVFDAHADASVFGWDAFVVDGEVEPRLDGDDDAGNECSRRIIAAALVGYADVVRIDAEVMARAVKIKFKIDVLFEDFFGRFFANL